MIQVPVGHRRFFLGRRVGNSVTFLFLAAGMGLRKFPESKCVVPFWSVTAAVGSTGQCNSTFSSEAQENSWIYWNKSQEERAGRTQVQNLLCPRAEKCSERGKSQITPVPGCFGSSWPYLGCTALSTPQIPFYLLQLPQFASHSPPWHSCILWMCSEPAFPAPDPTGITLTLAGTSEPPKASSEIPNLSQIAASIPASLHWWLLRDTHC